MRARGTKPLTACLFPAAFERSAQICITIAVCPADPAEAVLSHPSLVAYLSEDLTKDSDMKLTTNTQPQILSYPCALVFLRSILRQIRAEGGVGRLEDPDRDGAERPSDRPIRGTQIGSIE